MPEPIPFKNPDIIAPAPEAPSIPGVLARSAARNVLPTAGFIAAAPVGRLAGAAAGARTGALLGALVPGLGETGVSEGVGAVIGGLIGMFATGTAAATATKALQTGAADYVAPDSFLGTKSEQADMAAHPIASELGSLAVIGKPNPFNIIRAARTIGSDTGRAALADLLKTGATKGGYQEWAKTYSPEVQKSAVNVLNVAQAGGINAAFNVYDQIKSGNYSAGDLLRSAAEGALFNEPWIHAKNPATDSFDSALTPEQATEANKNLRALSPYPETGTPTNISKGIVAVPVGQRTHIIQVNGQDAAVLKHVDGADFQKAQDDAGASGWDGYFLKKDPESGNPTIYINMDHLNRQDSLFTHESTHLLEAMGLINQQQMDAVNTTYGQIKVKDADGNELPIAQEVANRYAKFNQDNSRPDQTPEDFQRELFANILQHWHETGTAPKDTFIKRAIDFISGIAGLDKSGEQHARDYIAGRFEKAPEEAGAPATADLVPAGAASAAPLPNLAFDKNPVPSQATGDVRQAEERAGAGVPPPAEGVEAGRPAVGAPPARPGAEPNAAVQQAANAYNEAVGLGPTQPHYVPVDEARARQIAAEYEKLPKTDQSPQTLASYEQLGKEIQQQWDYARNKMGITFEAWTKEGQPYANSREMVKDVRDNHHLYFFTGGDEHPLLNVKDADGLTLNDKLRAVHDLFGHAAEDFQFGARGEENAWIKHSQMFTPLAQKALTTETRGQNSWVNYGPHNYEATGARRNIKPQDRPFADQKVALLPDWVHDWKGPLNENQKAQFSVPKQAPDFTDLQWWKRDKSEPDAGARESGAPRTIAGNPRELAPGERDGKVTLTHWSNFDLHGKAIDPNFYGSGYAGEEKGRRVFKKSWLNRSYFGMKGYVKEGGLGRFKHSVTVDVNKLYDLKNDPDRLGEKVGAISDRLYPKGGTQADLTVYENLIKKAGYIGYYNTDYAVAALFDKVRVPARVSIIHSVENFKPATHKDMTPEELLTSAQQVRIKAPSGTTALRVIDSNGNTVIHNLSKFSTRNPLFNKDVVRVSPVSVKTSGVYKNHPIPVKGPVRVEPTAMFSVPKKKEFLDAGEESRNPRPNATTLPTPPTGGLKEIGDRTASKFNYDKNVLDENGAMKRFYHGTGKSDQLVKSGGFSYEKASDESLYGKGLYFTENPEIAGGTVVGADLVKRGYAGSSGAVIPVNINAKNLFDDSVGIPKQQAEKLVLKYIDKNGENDVQLNGKYGSFAAAKPVIKARESIDNSFRELIDDLAQEKSIRDLVKKYVPAGSLSGSQTIKDRLSWAFGRRSIHNSIASEQDKSAGGIRAESTGDIKQKIYQLDDLEKQSNALDRQISEAMGQVGKYSDFVKKVIENVDGPVKYGDLTDIFLQDKNEVNNFLRNSGYDGITHIGGTITGSDPHRVVIVFDPKQIRFAIGADQPFFSVPKNSSQELKKFPRTAIDILMDESVINPVRPKQVAEFDLMGDDEAAGSTSFSRVFAVADHLSRRSAQLGGGALHELNDTNAETLANTVANEAEYAINRDPKAIGWYDREMKAAMGQIFNRHPELKKDRGLQSVFKSILAITNNGQNVFANFAQADKLYTDWRTAGKVPDEENWGGKSKGAINDGLKMLNLLIEKLGTANLEKFLAKEFKVGDLKRAGFDISSENTEHMAHGSLIYGPKVGGGFYQNLIGNLNPITMDMWLMRTINRMRGTLTEPSLTALPDQIDRFIKSMKKQPDSEAIIADAKRVKQQILDGTLDVNKEKDAPGVMLTAAKNLYDDYRNSGFVKRTELNRSSKLIAEEFFGINEAPTSASERDFIRNVFVRAQEKLKAKKIDITNADLQAVLWYLEKDIYGKLGATDRRSAPASYSDAAAALNRKQLGLFDEEQGRSGDLRGAESAGPEINRFGEAGKQLTGAQALKRVSVQEAEPVPQFSVTKKLKFYEGKRFGDVKDEVVPEVPPFHPLGVEQFKQARDSIVNLAHTTGAIQARGMRINFANPDPVTAKRLGVDQNSMVARAIHAISNSDRRTANENKVLLADNILNTVKQADFVTKIQRDSTDGDNVGQYGTAFIKAYDIDGKKVWHLVQVDGNGDFITQFSWPDTEAENGRVMRSQIVQVGQRVGGLLESKVNPQAEAPTPSNFAPPTADQGEIATSGKEAQPQFSVAKEEKRAQVGGIPEVGQVRDTESISDNQAHIRERLFDGTQPVSDENTSAAWQVFDEMTGNNRSQIAGQLKDAFGGSRLLLGLYKGEVWKYARKLAVNGDDSLLRAMYDHSEQFETLAGGGASTAGSALRAEAENANDPVNRALQSAYETERENAAQSASGIDRETFTGLLKRLRSLKLTPDEVEKVVKEGKLPDGKTLEEALDELTPESKEAMALLDKYQRSQTEWLKPDVKKSIIRVIVDAAIGENKLARYDEKDFQDRLSTRLQEATVPKEVADQLAFEVWKDKAAREATKTDKAVKADAAFEQNRAQAILDKLQSDQTEVFSQARRSKVADIVKAFYKNPAASEEVRAQQIAQLEKDLVNETVKPATAKELAREAGQRKLVLEANDRLAQEKVTANEAQQTAERELAKFEEKNSGVEWLKEKGKRDQVLQAIADALKSKSPILDDPTPLVNETKAKLTALGVDEATAGKLAFEIETVRRTQFANSRVKAMENAAKSKSLRSLIESILETPYRAQSDPKWLHETAVRWFESNGLGKDQAEAAARLFDKEFKEALAQASTKVAEAELKKKVSPRTYDDLERLIRAGIFDPDKNWIDQLAAKNGWKKPSRDQMLKLQELEHKLSDPELSPEEVRDIQEQQMHVLRHVGKKRGQTLRALGESFTASLLSGIRTLTVQTSPTVMALRDLPIMALSDPKNAMNFAKAMYNSFKANAVAAFKFAWMKDAYGFHLSELEHGFNEMKRISEETDQVVNSKTSTPVAKALAYTKKLYALQRFVFRNLNSIDQASMAVTREWKLAYYSASAFKEAGLTNTDISQLIDHIEMLRKNEFEKAIDAGLDANTAKVRANSRVADSVWDFVNNKTGRSDLADQVIKATENDVYSTVGRVPHGLNSTDEGFLTRFSGFNHFLQFVSKVRGEGGLQNIGTTALIGMINIPFRTTRYFSDFSPYGLLRYGIYKYRLNRGKENFWKQTYGNALQARARLYSALAGTVAMAAATAWALKSNTADDKAGDEDFGLYITGKGPNNKVLADAWVKRGFKQYSANFVFGGHIVAIPLTRAGEALMMPFILPAALDDYAWKSKEAEAGGHPIKTPISSATASLIGEAMYMTGQSGILQTFGQLQQATENGGSLGKAAVKVGVSAASSTVLPFRQLLASVSEMLFGSMDNSSISSLIANQFPIVGLPFQNPAVNRFGDPMYDRSWYGLIARTGVPIAFQISRSPENERLYTTLVEKGISPPPLNRSDLESKYGDMTDQQFKQFATVSGQALKQAITKNLPDLQGMSSVDAKNLMFKLAMQANAQAAMAIGVAPQPAAGQTAAAGSAGAAPSKQKKAKLSKASKSVRSLYKLPKMSLSPVGKKSHKSTTARRGGSLYGVQPRHLYGT